jgi:hypothetical protein
MASVQNEESRTLPVQAFEEHSASESGTIDAAEQITIEQYQRVAGPVPASRPRAIRQAAGRGGREPGQAAADSPAQGGAASSESEGMLWGKA